MTAAQQPAQVQTLPQRSAPRRGRRDVRRAIFLLLFCVFTFLWMLPALWSLVTSFRYEADIQRQLIGLPFPVTLDHYQRILGDGLVVKWFTNSLAVALARTVIQLTLCSLAAFAFARIPFPGKRVVEALELHILSPIIVGDILLVVLICI
jgi:multiple sugar transport system permease protein